MGDTNIFYRWFCSVKSALPINREKAVSPRHPKLSQCSGLSLKSQPACALSLLSPLADERYYLNHINSHHLKIFITIPPLKKSGKTATPKDFPDIIGEDFCLTFGVIRVAWWIFTPSRPAVTVRRLHPLRVFRTAPLCACSPLKKDLTGQN